MKYMLCDVVHKVGFCDVILMFIQQVYIFPQQIQESSEHIDRPADKQPPII